MNNSFQLTVILHQIKPLRYTPAGIPVLDVVLQHESWQEENGLRCLVKFTLPAKIIGQQAQAWQHREGDMVDVMGFMAQRNQTTYSPTLRIQHITEYKG